MDYLSKYAIAFKGLKEGSHSFEFEIDDKFFEKFENSEVQKGSLKADVVLTKQSTLMILDLAVKGTVELICDRCLEVYHQKIKNESKMFVKFSHNEDEDMSEEIIVISYEEYQINVAQYLYELIILGLPIRHIHPTKKGKSECNPEMVEKLNQYLVEEAPEEEEPIDERWSELKKLLDNK
jgi:uncharacterized protein